MRLTIVISALAILFTACSFFDADDPVRPTLTAAQMEQETPAIETTADISNGSKTLRPDPDHKPGQALLGSTPTGPTQLTQADQNLAEQQRWCQAWALDNLEPPVYVEFLELDPTNMDDIDRTIWRDRLRNGSCSMYGREPLDVTNADRRNEQYKESCLHKLVELVDSKWDGIAEAAYKRDNPVAYEIPNQHVRIMRWMHLSGEELLAMDEPPYELLNRLHGQDYGNEHNVPSADRLVALQAEYGDEFTTEWWDLPMAALGNRAQQENTCRQYYPQVFSGYWIPYAQPPQTTTLPTSTPFPWNLAAQEERDSKIPSILQSSLYLPKP